MVLGQDGMIYGATFNGGPKYTGMLFRIDPTTQKITGLHSIDDGNGGTISGRLTVGPDGTLYGTTSQGSTAKYNCGGQGCGAVFKFDPRTLKFTVLHSFTGGADGGYPEGSTVISANGQVLYGTTAFGGAHDHCALYKINLATNKLAVLHAFTGGINGGMKTYGHPSLAVHAGKLFGTTDGGGYPKACNNQGCGTVFELIP